MSFAQIHVDRFGCFSRAFCCFVVELGWITKRLRLISGDCGNLDQVWLAFHEMLILSR